MESDTARVADRLEKFCNYEAGWHFGDGKKISKGACEIALALSIHVLALGFSQQDVFPLVDGGIMFCLYLPAGKRLEITIYPSLLIEFEEEDGDEQINSIFGLSQEDVIKRLDKYTWLLSGTTPN